MSEMTKIELVGARRYGYKGDKYEQNVHYLVKSDRAKLLLRLTTDQGFFVFREVGKAFSPAATRQPVQAPARPAPVVDTSKTEAQMHDEALAQAAAKVTEEEKPVVDLSQSEPREDITEEEAAAVLTEADEAEAPEEVVAEEVKPEDDEAQDAVPV